MIRAGVLERETAAPLMDVCPSCDGNGEIFVERLFGRNAPEPYLSRTCGACGGRGVVSAEAVVHCAQPDCGAPIWADRACTHGTDSPLCSDHRPARCAGCIDEDGGLDR